MKRILPICLLLMYSGLQAKPYDFDNGFYTPSEVSSYDSIFSDKPFEAPNFLVAKTIFGHDKRDEIINAGNPITDKLKKSVAGMIPKDNLSIDGMIASFERTTLVDYDVCSSAKFSDQPLTSDCTGFLISHNMIMTAGHCVTSFKDCSDYYWAFDLDLENVSDLDLDMKDVYNCKQIIARELNEETHEDYVIIELDRTVYGRVPVQFSQKKISIGDNVAMIGHPTGLPMKISPEGIVNDVEENFILAKIDSFGGNSGSPVYESSTGDVIGLLRGGGEDFYQSYEGCLKYSICIETNNSSSCSGEEIFRLDQFDFDTIFSQNNNQDPLFQAVFLNDLDEVRNLLDSGHNINVVERSDNASALVMAIEMGHYDIADLLIDSGIDLDAKTRIGRETALTLAIYNELIDLSIKLIKEGAKVNIKTREGFDARDLADQSGIYEIIELLE